MGLSGESDCGTQETMPTPWEERQRVIVSQQKDEFLKGPS